MNKKIFSLGWNDSSVVQIETTTVLAGTIKTRFLRTGEGNPVILLHGGGAGAIAWCKVIKDLSKFFCVIAPDLVGYGESDKPHAVYNRHFFSSWLKNFMDTLGLKKSALVGHSLGGAIAIQFTADHPEHVERLALVSSAGLGFSIPFIPLLHGLFLYSFPSKMTSWLLHACLVHRPACLDEKFIEYAEQVCRKPGGRRAFWSGCGKSVLPISFDCLKKITQRTLLIWGAEDRVFPLTHAYKAIPMLPHAKLHVIPQAGHIPFFDQPDVFNTILLRFLEEGC